MQKSPGKRYSPIMMAFLCWTLVVHTGVIRKNEDPVRDTQTDPITLKQKIEELKDGPKGAPAPSFRFYKKDEDFDLKTPMETHEEQRELEALLKAREDRIPDFGEPIPEDYRGYEEGTDSWWGADTWDDGESGTGADEPAGDGRWKEDW